MIFEFFIDIFCVQIKVLISSSLLLLIKVFLQKDGFFRT